MTLWLAQINFHGDAATAGHSGPLTLGVMTLITVTAIVAGVTCWRARAAWTGARELHLPRRGTSAVLLGAISAVLLVLVSTSQQRIPSLTIVSHAGSPQRNASPRREVSAFERSALPQWTVTFAAPARRAQERRQCSVTVHSVMRARWRPAP